MIKKELEQEMESAEEVREDVIAPEDPEQAAPEDEDFYRSQKEIDAVIGKRLHQERERWERQHAGAMLLEKAAGDMSTEQAVALLLARSNGLDEQDVANAMRQGASLSEIVEAARGDSLRRQAETVAAGDPDFDMEAAMANPAFRALVESGEPIEKAYGYLTMDARIESERMRAQNDLLHSIQSRKTRPGALRPAGAGNPQNADHLPDSMIRMIDERLKRGEKVRI